MTRDDNGELQGAISSALAFRTRRAFRHDTDRVATELEAASDDVGKAQNEVELGKVDHNEGKLRRPPRANGQLGGHLAGGKL